MPKKRIGFYCELPRATVAEIKKTARCKGWPQWRVVADCIGGVRRKARGMK